MSVWDEGLARALHPALCEQGAHFGAADPAEPCWEVALLMSPWLRAHDDRIRAEALRGLADTLEADHSDLPDVMGVVRWMRANDPAALRAAAGTPTHHTTEEDADA